MVHKSLRKRNNEMMAKLRQTVLDRRRKEECKKGEKGKKIGNGKNTYSYS